MSLVKEVEILTQERLVKILEDTYKKGSESTNVNSKQLVEEIATFLKPYVEPVNN
ncbi:hypothetical protein [Alkalihalobacillus deserti]|uniref:hypothetical protein n=1 Tax=Alkalihalobacillus deserti TaxID=2879466 RepID=UPI001D134C05|nr:hypothetical protein [Alkalihalobacillus deserti]